LAKSVAQKRSTNVELPKSKENNIAEQKFPALPKPKFVPAPPPKSNAWSKKPQVTATKSAPAPPQTEETSASSDFSIKDVINMTKDLIDVKSVISFIIKIVSRCKSEAKNFQDVLTIVLEEISGALFSFAI
jgi:hypothetical protein